VPGLPSFTSDSGPTSPEWVRLQIEDALRPENFFLAPPAELIPEHRSREEMLWEVFHGQLLDGRRTRARRTFESWNLFWADLSGRSGEPILAVLLDAPDEKLHITRGLLCHVWEPYDAGANVIETRGEQRWLRELVGSVDLAPPSPERVQEEMVRLLFRAVVGTSRLPLTSVEAPLPGFSLGSFAYVYRPGVGDHHSRRHVSELIRDIPVGPARDGTTSEFHPEIVRLERVKLLEFVLRASRSSEVADVARRIAEGWQEIGLDARGIQQLLREVYNEVALSPYTDFVENTLRFVRATVDQKRWSDTEQCDFLGWLLRQTGRHLTAYDLITFHHHGANYPDALLLDAVMKECLRLIERNPEAWRPDDRDDEAAARRKRLNRRGLRQAWLLRRFYEGLPVPASPTSPGENIRVLPPPHERVPDEQLYLPHRRPKRLFDGDPMPRHLGPNGLRVLRQSVEDLRDPAELRELGTALFLDRPLGVGKHPLEPDQTPLLSYVAFSRSVAEKRLAQLAGDGEVGVPAATVEAFRTAFRQLPPTGVPVPLWRAGPIPVVALQDAYKAADDFVLLQTTAATLRDFLELYDWTPLRDLANLGFLFARGPALLLGGVCESGEPLLRAYDARHRLRLELRVCLEQGYAARNGVELPLAGFQALRIWEEEGATGIDVCGRDVTIRPRIGEGTQ
jgi:hypothetical protein